MHISQYETSPDNYEVIMTVVIVENCTSNSGLRRNKSVVGWSNTGNSLLHSFWWWTHDERRDWTLIHLLAFMHLLTKAISWWRWEFGSWKIIHANLYCLSDSSGVIGGKHWRVKYLYLLKVHISGFRIWAKINACMHCADALHTLTAKGMFCI